MKEKIVNFFKKDGIFLVFCVTTIFYALLVVSTSSNNGTYTVLHPFNNTYAMISYIIIIVFVFFAIILLIYTSLYVQWTAVAAPMVNGVQARYFIPILVLTSFAFNSKFIIWNKQIPYRYIILFMLFVNINAISNIILFYI